MAVLGKEILVDLTVLERRDGETNPAMERADVPLPKAKNKASCTTSPTKQTQTNKNKQMQILFTFSIKAIKFEGICSWPIQCVAPGPLLSCFMATLTICVRDTYNI